MIEYEFLIPLQSNLGRKRMLEITQEDNHPTEKELLNGYGAILSKVHLKYGDVLRLQSKDDQSTKYYFLTKDGLKEIKTQVR